MGRFLRSEVPLYGVSDVDHWPRVLYFAVERRGNNLKRFEDFYLKAKARIWYSKGQNLALTVLNVTYSIGSVHALTPTWLYVC